MPPPPSLRSDPSPASGRGVREEAKGLLSVLNPSPGTGEGSERSDGGGGFFAENITQTEAGWQFTVQGVPVAINSLSRHDIGNALAALAVADALGVPLETAAAALKDYAPPPMRMTVIKTVCGVGRS